MKERANRSSEHSICRGLNFFTIAKILDADVAHCLGDGERPTSEVTSWNPKIGIQIAQDLGYILRSGAAVARQAHTEWFTATNQLDIV